MDLSLTDEQQEIQDVFRGFFSKEVPISLVRDSEAEGFDAEVWRRLSAMDVVSMAVPEASGGAGTGLLDVVLVLEEAGRRLAPVPLVEVVVTTRLLARLGNDDAEQHLVAAMNGESIPTLALQRPTGGVARAVPAGRVADVVIALDGDELVVASGSDARSEAPRATLGGVPIAHWDFTERVVLAKGDDAVAAFALAESEWRLLTAALLCGLATEALAIAVDYSKTRHAFGVPIGSFQALADRLADVKAYVDGLGLLLREAAWAFDEEPDRAQLLAQMAFAHAATTARDATSWGLHVHGGYGFTLEYDIQLYLKRAKAWTAIGGDPRRAYVRVADLVIAARQEG